MRLALLLLLLILPAQALADSRDPVEPAPLAVLGPPSGAGVRAAPTASRIEVAATRRGARLTASFSLEAPQGPLLLTLPSSLFQVALRVDDVPIAAAVEHLAAPAAAAATDVRIDPKSGRPYARGPIQAEAVRFLHRISVTVPPSGRLVLSASAVLSSGFDRKRWRRFLVEQTHLLHNRPDFFVYHYGAQGPGGPIHIERPPRTTAAARVEAGALRIAAAARRPVPLGASFGLGLAFGNGEADGEGSVTRALVRASLDLLLPIGDALSLSADVASQLTGRHQVAAALVYQLYTPVFPYLIVPIGGHLDLGPALDVWPTLRPGLRVGLGAHLSALGLLLNADLFPERAAPPPGEAGPDRTLVRYRIGLLLSLGL